jgi:putative photosynthetic complex assembly protein
MALTAAQPANASRWPFYAAAALVIFAIGATMFGQRTEIGTLRYEEGQPVDIRDIRLLEGADGVITVSDAQLGDEIARFQPGEGGFVRGSLQGLRRDRTLRQVRADAPYRLILWDNHRLTLSDTGTGLRVDLLAFGPTNAGAFAKFLDRGRKKQ